MAKFKVGDKATPIIQVLSLFYGKMDVVRVDGDTVYCRGAKGNNLCFSADELKIEMV